jgi:hypothetical protein
LANNNLEEPFQSAYKRFHSAETTLLKVQNDILIAIDNSKCVVLLLLDMSAAFDTVDHELLLQRMFKRFGIDGPVLKWFQSYLQNRAQSVVIDGVKSISKDLPCGVPQGSVLGPILYLLYILHPLVISSEVMVLIFTFTQMTHNYISLLSRPLSMGVPAGGGGGGGSHTPPVCWANKASRAIFASQLGNIGLLQK